MPVPTGLQQQIEETVMPHSPQLFDVADAKGKTDL